MQFLSSKNFALFSSIVIIIGVLVYVAFIKDEAKVVDSLLVSELVNPGVERDPLAVLKELQSIKLDESLFGSVLFISLNDFGRPIIPEPSGRTNPFAPIDFNSLKKSTSSNVSFLEESPAQ